MLDIQKVVFLTLVGMLTTIMVLSILLPEPIRKKIGLKDRGAIGMITRAIVLTIPVASLILVALRDTSEAASYLAKVEAAATFRGAVSCEAGATVYKGTQSLSYKYENTEYLMQYPVVVAGQQDYLCKVGLYPRVENAAALLGEDREMLKAAIREELLRGTPLGYASEHQRAVAKRIAEVLHPRTVAQVKLEFNEDLSKVEKVPLPVKVPLHVLPATASADSKDVVILQQISGQ